MLAHGAEPEPEARFIEHEPYHKHQYERYIRRSVCVEHVVKEAVLCKRFAPFAAKVGVAPFKKAVEYAGKLIGHWVRFRIACKEQAANVNGNAAGKEVYCRAGYGLVRLAGYAGKAVYQRKNHARKARAKERQPRIAGKIAHGSAGEGAYCHHALYTDVYNAGFFGAAGAERRKQQRGSIHKRGIKHNAERFKQLVHVIRLPYSFCCCLSSS